jgi:hypothetical protein
MPEKVFGISLILIGIAANVVSIIEPWKDAPWKGFVVANSLILLGLVYIWTSYKEWESEDS